MNDNFNDVKSIDKISIPIDNNADKENENLNTEFEKDVEKKQPKKRQLKQTKINIANAKSEKYYKQFDFFFNRSCFRIMTEFFKDKFNKFYADRQFALKKNNF